MGRTEEPLRRLTLLHTNDVHSHLLPFDHVDFGKDVGGVARRAEMIKLIASQTPSWLLVDGGDLFQGTPFYTAFLGEVDVRASEACGYTATVLGNHDLDDGLANLQKQYASTSMALLCANVADEVSGKPILTPWKIVERDGLKIGLVGAIGSAAWDVISHKKRKGMTFQDHEMVVASVASHLRPAVDLVVLLSHAGYEADMAFAARAKDVDVIVGGHTNTYLTEPVLVKHIPALVKNSSKRGLQGTLVVQAFKWGVFLGRLDLAFLPDGSIASYSGRLMPIDSSIQVSAENRLVRLVDSYYERIHAQTSQLIGQCDSGMIYPDADKHLRVFPLGVWVCEAMREALGADFALINSGTIRDRIPPGALTMGTLLSVLPFDNTVVTYRLKGRDVLAMLNYITANHGKISGYQFAGLEFKGFVSKGEIVGLKIGGTPVNPEKIYSLVTISYLADGNQNGKILFHAATDRYDTGFFLRDLAIERIRKSGSMIPPNADGVRFEP